jgi:hypothetical protein
VFSVLCRGGDDGEFFSSGAVVHGCDFCRLFVREYVRTQVRMGGEEAVAVVVDNWFSPSPSQCFHADLIGTRVRAKLSFALQHLCACVRWFLIY